MNSLAAEEGMNLRIREPFSPAKERTEGFVDKATDGVLQVIARMEELRHVRAQA